MSYTGNTDYINLSKDSTDDEIKNFIRNTKNGNRVIRDVIESDYVHDLSVVGINNSRSFKLIREVDNE